MNLRKGILRIAGLVAWGLLWMVLCSVILPGLALFHGALDMRFFLAVFVVGFYPIPVVLIKFTHPVSDLKEFPAGGDRLTTFVWIGSFIAAMVVITIHAFVASSVPNAPSYLLPGVIAFFFIYGSYMLGRWVVEGFRQTRRTDSVQ
jgi:hypothetical protein